MPSLVTVLDNGKRVTLYAPTTLESFVCTWQQTRQEPPVILFYTDLTQEQYEYLNTYNPTQYLWVETTLELMVEEDEPGYGPG
jgi:outer membrane lipoprotein-sorting protein